MDNNDKQQFDRLEEVKKLIFGEEIKTYNSEIDTLKSQLETYKTEVSVKIDDVKIELLRSIENSEKRLLEVISKLQTVTSEEIDVQKNNHISKNSLGRIFEDISKGLGQ